METNRRNSARRKSFLFRCLLVFAFLAAFFWWSNHSLQVTRWEAVFPDLPEGFDDCRIVVLSDLHGAEFGEHNARLFQTVAKLNPEFIFFLGDLEDQRRGSVEGYAEEIADGLSAIAPVYYITGNHEWAIGSVPRLKERLSEHGMTVLSNAFVPLERDGDSILLAGIDDPNGYAGQKSPEELAAEIQSAYGDCFWFLLAHRNNLFPTSYYRLGADLTVRRVFLAKFLTNVENVLLGTLWSAIMTGKAWMVLAPARALKNLVMFPIQSLLLCALFAALLPALRRAKLIPYETAARLRL